MARKPDGSRRKRVMKRIVGILLVMMSLALFLYPAAASVINNWHQHATATSMRSSEDSSDDPARLSSLASARAWNASLAKGGWSDDSVGLGGLAGGAEDLRPTELADAARAEYSEQLTWFGEDPMCSIEIPTIGTVLAVYHGSDDTALSAGAGHIEWSSLPVGGLSSHCVISAHSGVKSARMFDDLRIMKVGDLVVLRTLGDAYAYRVYEIEDMVDPYEADAKLQIVEGRDLLSLMTCTPYGVNSHRILVHCERVKYVPSEPEAEWNATREYVNDMTMPLIKATGIAFVAWLGWIALAVIHQNGRRKRRAANVRRGSGAGERGRADGNRGDGDETGAVDVKPVGCSPESGCGAAPVGTDDAARVRDGEACRAPGAEEVADGSRG